MKAKEKTISYYQTRPIFKKIDLFMFLVLLIVLIVCMVIIFSRAPGAKAKIIIDSKEYALVRLDENKIIHIEEHNVIIEVKENTIAIINSDCPNQICVKTGKIANSNEVILCAPKKILIIIENNQKEKIHYTGNIYGDSHKHK